MGLPARIGSQKRALPAGARRRLWKRSLPRRKRKKKRRRRPTAPAVQSQPRQPGPGLNVPEPGGAADWFGSGGRTIQHPRRVTGRWGPNRLGCHSLERERGKPFLLGDRAGTRLRGREMGRPSRGGSISVAQHQPDGVRLLLGRARGLCKTLRRLSVTGTRGLQCSLNSSTPVGPTEEGATCRTVRPHSTVGL